jgi:hypothetical protein
MAMLFEIQIRIQNAQVFHNEKEALEWLNADTSLVKKKIN